MLILRGVKNPNKDNAFYVVPFYRLHSNNHTPRFLKVKEAVLPGEPPLIDMTYSVPFVDLHEPHARS